jgi:hypothetical protein
MKWESFFYGYNLFFFLASQLDKKKEKEKKEEVTSLMCLFLLHKPKDKEKFKI